MLTWVTHHRLLLLGLGITVLVATTVVGTWFFVLRSPVTRINLGHALNLYRHGQQAGPGGSGPALPPSGVYRYRTTGGEQLSFAGIRRTFPGETDMIVTDAACSTMTWEPFEQHVEGLVACPGGSGGLTISAAPNVEVIAGIRTSNDIRCQASAYLLPPEPNPGGRWSSTCHAGGRTVGFTGEFIGPSSVVVGTERVPALHTRVTLSFAGSTSGTNPTDYWLSAGNGVILREHETVDMVQRSGPLGTVRYTEDMTVTLVSLEPLR